MNIQIRTDGYCTAAECRNKFVRTPKHTHTHTPPLSSKTNSHISGNILNLLLEKVNSDSSLDGHKYQNTVVDFRACAYSTADVSPQLLYQKITSE